LSPFCLWTEEDAVFQEDSLHSSDKETKIHNVRLVFASKYKVLNKYIVSDGIDLIEARLDRDYRLMNLKAPL
jgi:hypothetical protein